MLLVTATAVEALVSVCEIAAELVELDEVVSCDFGGGSSVKLEAAASAERGRWSRKSARRTADRGRRAEDGRRRTDDWPLTLPSPDGRGSRSIRKANGFIAGNR
jgi:hypothetical protein